MSGITDIKIMGMLVALAMVGALVSVWAGFMLTLATTVLYGMAYKMNMPEGLDDKLKSNEVLNLHITRSKKIRIRRLVEEKGYVRLPKNKEKLFELGEWYKITPNTTYTLRAKPTVFTMEGIAHTIKVEALFAARMMAMLKLKDKNELAKFLDISPSMITGEKEEPREVVADAQTQTQG